MKPFRLTIPARPKDNTIKLVFKCPHCKRQNQVVFGRQSVEVQAFTTCGCGREFMLEANLSRNTTGGLPVTITTF